MGIIKALSTTRLTKTDMVFLTLKFAFLFFLCVQTSVLFGLALALITFFVIEKIIQVCFGVEPLNATDKNVFYDQETNRCHIIGTILLERTDADTVRDVIAERMTSKFYRLRSKMVKILDSYYFKELSSDELKIQVASSIFVRPDIKSMEEMSELMS